MATDYPTAIDGSSTLPNPSAGNFTNSPSLSGAQTNQNDAIKAIETKLGTGSSTPASNKVLLGTGAGASTWQQLTSAELRGVLSDETGTGSAVFATTPTLTTPKVNTINEETAANGVTVDGLNIKDSKLNTNNSVVTANYTNSSVTADKLSTGAAYNSIVTSQTTTSTSFTDLATVGPAVTVTIGVNGLAFISFGATISNSGANLTSMSVAVSGASTVAAADIRSMAHVGTAPETVMGGFLLTGLTAGSNTITAKYSVAAGTGTFSNRHISVVPL